MFVLPHSVCYVYVIVYLVSSHYVSIDVNTHVITRTNELFANNNMEP